MSKLYVLKQHLEAPLINETLQALCVKLPATWHLDITPSQLLLFRQKIPHLSDETRRMLFLAAYDASSEMRIGCICEQLLPYIDAETLEKVLSKSCVVWKFIDRPREDGIYGRWIQIVGTLRVTLMKDVVYDNASHLTRHLCRYPNDVQFLPPNVTPDIIHCIRALYDAGHINADHLLSAMLTSRALGDGPLDELIINCINQHPELLKTTSYRAAVSRLTNTRKDLQYTITQVPEKGTTP